MTYRQFHYRFNLLPLLLLCLLAVTVGWGKSQTMAAGIVLAIVVIVTSPWDNYAVATGIWGFSSGATTIRIGWLPIEEYAFFLIQSLEVMFAVDIALHWLPAARSLPGGESGALPDGARGLLAGLLVLWLLTGVFFRRRCERGMPGRYAWHLLYWLFPVAAGQWIIGWPVLWPRLGVIAGGALPVAIWLIWADLHAVRAGIWYFDSEQITGWRWRGVLPWEEVVFFGLTSLLVAQSFLLFLPEAAR